MPESAHRLALAAQLGGRGGEGGHFLAKKKKNDNAGILKRGPGCLWNQCSGPAGTRLPPMGRFWHCGAEQRRLGGAGGDPLVLRASS